MEEDDSTNLDLLKLIKVKLKIHIMDLAEKDLGC
jgi:hypothetical protein